jgi:hypothetical protein
VLKNLTLRFVKTALYGLAGNAGAMLLHGLGSYVPAGDAVTLYLWQGLAVGAISGAAHAIMRWASWDPSRGTLRVVSR